MIKGEERQSSLPLFYFKKLRRRYGRKENGREGGLYCT
jgi:hypothetical protein